MTTDKTSTRERDAGDPEFVRKLLAAAEDHLEQAYGVLLAPYQQCRYDFDQGMESLARANATMPVARRTLLGIGPAETEISQTRLDEFSALWNAMVPVHARAILDGYLKDAAWLLALFREVRAVDWAKLRDSAKRPTLNRIHGRVRDLVFHLSRMLLWERLQEFQTEFDVDLGLPGSMRKRILHVNDLRNLAAHERSRHWFYPDAESIKVMDHQLVTDVDSVSDEDAIESIALCREIAGTVDSAVMRYVFLEARHGEADISTMLMESRGWIRY